MFRQVECTLELANKFGLHFPEFSSPIRFEVEQRIPVTKLDLYVFETSSTQYFYGFKIQKFIMYEVYAASFGLFDPADFITGLRIFLKTVDLLDSKKRFLTVMDEQYHQAFLPLIEEFNLEHIFFPSYLYYMTPEQEKLLLSTPELPLPEGGYTLGSAGPDDAEFITNTWIHKAPGETEQTKAKISAFPSSAIRYNGQLVAFEMVHANGMINHQYVVPEHRGKGLGLIVEQDLARKMIREKLIVYKTVETPNNFVIERSNESTLWTVRKKSDGTPDLRTYTPLWPVGMNPFKEE